jgi:hypothetical protein
MSTRSRIGIEFSTVNGAHMVKSIYCHFDGYPDGVGQKLMGHYQNREKVESLIELGDISYIAPNVTPSGPHSFDEPERGVVVAYHRDRGEKYCDPRVDASVSQFVSSDVEEYGYLFTEEGEWLFVNGHLGSDDTDRCLPLQYVLSGIETTRS